ncbi:hypothetical protein P175DRAFT_0514665 [Aspergillus ochraceoroseus IBT 24754]|uniref:DNA mismatch repair protein MSH5 n=1 Tax=Aspergillus ochraceoroseus IBT 24754 TaxID=1392256 RepID=A0A2T5M265_9EURO|nr:uncharacterized protein P175DRAFT_0514665 [Aspergillus ochraceoroseus IBT 24754]PTU22616.1 hypothetical protein P175DRAFT_0514665 [Aspergillus ochraceoroseus IBT 24754]
MPTSIPQTNSQGIPRLRQPHQNNITDQIPGAASLEDSVDDDLDQVIAAIDMRDSGTVGCSYYSAQEKKLYLHGDIRYSNTEIIDTLILQAKPTVLLTSTRIDHINRQGQELDREDGSRRYLPYQLDVRPSQEFNFSKAMNKLVSLGVSSKHEDRIKFLVPHNGLAETDQVDSENLDFTLQEGRHLHLSSFIDLENKVTIGCAGAILTYLQRRRSSDSLSEGMTSRVYDVALFEISTLTGAMFVTTRTLASLQIMESESHPSVVNQGPGGKSSSSKEGLSVYGLFQRFACTPQGKQSLRQIFLRPSVQLDVIQERQRFISVYLQADNYNSLTKMVKSLKYIKNLRPVMINLRKGVNTGSGKVSGFKATVWATLLAFAFYGIDIHDALRETSGGNGLAVLRKALHNFEAAQLYRVGRMIQEIVDIDSSDEQGRTTVKPGLDRELDRMKDSYDGLNSLLKKVAIQIATTIPESLDIDVNVIYFPQLGFNIAIPLKDTGEAAYNGSKDGWELIFMTENRAYFKDFRMKEMDEKLGDIYSLICEKEIEIVYDLAQRVLQYEKVLLEASDICGELDSLLAMVQSASYYKLIRPKIVQDNIIRINGGRHFLQELVVPSYVPNDTFLVGGRLEEPVNQTQNTVEITKRRSGPCMLVLTGPNYSGKSVYMKQVALIVYLAQTGSFIPAESAEIGVVDKILVKSNSQDSVSLIQSTFMNDLQQISFDLKHITARSLLLIDEFGKGTCENDGIGLACGIFEHLLSLESAPKVIAATHFHEIFENELIELARPRLQLGHMEVRVSEDAHESDDQITYLYNFRLGKSNKSFGTVCAAMNGINQAIVDRANELASLSARGENLIAACARLSADEMQMLQNAETLARRFLEIDLSGANDRENIGLVLKELLDELTPRQEYISSEDDSSTLNQV